MRPDELRSLLESCRDGECPPEAAIDCLKEIGAWPWVWQEGRGVSRLLFREGTAYAWVYFGGEEYPHRLELGMRLRGAMNAAGVVIGTTYGPLGELRALAEVVALRAELDEMLTALGDSDGCAPEDWAGIPF
jgi:hypothetical protein